MASIKVKFRPSASPGCEGTIFYQVVCKRRSRHISSDYRLLPGEWDGVRARVLVDSAEGERYVSLLSIRDGIARDVNLLRNVVKRLQADCTDGFTAEDIVDGYRRSISERSFMSYIGLQIARLRRCGRIRTAETYRATMRSFMKFRNGRDLRLDMISAELTAEYEAWLFSFGLVPNTISFYMRILRAVYNRAVEERIIEQCYPFRHVYTGIDKTVKRALPLPAIRRIKILDLSAEPSADYARDMFLLSFYLRGMSFIDMAFLKKTDLNCGRITYRRRKTGQLLSVEWAREMQTILDKYPRNPTQYLLPIITNTRASAIHTYRNVGYNINRALKQVAGLAGVTVPLTLYCARHSWASVAWKSGIPLRIISEGMGHTSEATTRIYLASIDNADVDKANAQVIRSLKKQ